MRIQGKRVWIAGQFMAAQMEIEDGTIKRIDGYGTGPADQDYGDRRILRVLLISIPTAPMILTPMTGSLRAFADG